MHRDLAARRASAQIDADGSIYYPDLGYGVIRDYHEFAFRNLGGTVPDGQGVTIEAWTAYAPIEVLGTSTWERMLADSLVEQLGVGAGVAAQMVVATWTPLMSGMSFEKQPLAERWLDTLWQARSAPFAEGSPLAFPTEVENAYIVMGTRGDDTLRANEEAAQGRDIMLLGLNGNDTITAAQSGGYVDAGAGDDLIIGQGSNAKVDGGSGFDSLQLNAPDATSKAYIFIDDAYYDKFSGGSYYFTTRPHSTTSGIEGERFARIETLAGTSGDDRFLVYTLSTQVLPNITLDAGPGIDEISLEFLGDLPVVVDLLQTRNSAEILGVTDPGSITFNLSNFENVTTGKGNDIVFGSNSDNAISVGDGRNEAHGRDGNDRLSGGKGIDRLYGDRGKDEILGHDGNDLLDGGDNDDKLYGMEGDDILQGGSGNDFLTGGSGKDLLDGGAGDNELFAYEAEGGDTLRGALETTGFMHQAATIFLKVEMV
ncbi:calcium-binding protein [Methylobacterium nodulans]|nr:calcium-binding protein [Methylobacterium nodulans]